MLEDDLSGAGSDGSATPSDDLLELQRRPLRDLKPYYCVGVGSSAGLGGRFVGLNVPELLSGGSGEGVGGPDPPDALDDGSGVLY